MPVSKPAIVSVIVLLLLALGRISQGAEQYKKLPRESIARIVDGQPDKAIGAHEDYLKEHPDDLESLYVLAVAYTHKGQITKALSYMNKALDGGLPFERFQAGPRDLLEPLTASEAFQALAEKHGQSLLQGPLLSVTDSQVRCWVRTAQEAAVTLRVRKAQKATPKSAEKTTTNKTEHDRDFTTVLSIDGLAPETRYAYEVAGRKGHFTTFPKLGKPGTFTIGFGGGAGFTPQYERMWNTTRSRNLTAFLFLGDNVYIDNPTRQAVQKYCYYRRQSRPEFRQFAAGTPIYAIWDDHDFTVDDGWGGPDIHDPAWKVPVWRTFQNNWANPYYGGGEKQPGCWFDFAIADVDFFMLDGRYYREKGRRQKVEVENPSMLGQAQKHWLFEKLTASNATFKVLASPVPWAFGAKPGRGGMDTWEGFHEERDEIFAFLTRHKIEGVLLISADRHRSDAWKIERPKGYPLYEFESSRLTNIHTHPVMPGSLFGYNKTCSFGHLSFDTTQADPTVTYRVVTIDNEVVHTLTLSRSQLVHTDK